MFGKNPANVHEKLCIDPRPKLVGEIYNTLWNGIATSLPHMSGRYVKKHSCKRFKFYYMPDEIPGNKIENYDRLHKKVEKMLTAPLACALGEVDEEEEEILRNVVLLQSIIKGRAIQSMVLRHLKSHRDLVRELKSTVGLNPKDRLKKLKVRKDILKGIREFNTAMQKKGKIIGLIENLEGHTISSMLDLTSKALVRLEDEKRIHLYALAAERERWARESAEAGRRQQEEIRQRQHEEIYKQMLKMHEISSDVLLAQTVEEQVKDTSKALATVWAEKHAKEIDDVVDLSQLEEFEKFEHLTKLYNQFLMNELEKNRIRDEIRTKTAGLRKFAQTQIYAVRDELEEAESSSNYSGTSFMRKLCKAEKEEEEWDEFHDEILNNTPEMKHLLAGDIDKIPLYEEPTVIETLQGKQDDEIKTEGLASEEINDDNGINKVEEEEELIEEENEPDDKKNIKRTDQENQSSESSSSSTKPTVEGKSDTSEESIIEESSSSIYDVMDQEDVKYINKFLSDPLSSDSVLSSDFYESSETKISSKDLEAAERRREKYEEEENKRFFKNMAKKLMEEIMDTATAIAKKVQDLTKNREEISYNEACADALIQAYKVVSKALLKCSQNFSEDILRRNLEPWLDIVLGEAEKKVFELFDTVKKGKEMKEEEQVKEVEDEKNLEDGFENLIEEVTAPSQERIHLIPEAASGEHFFKGPLYWCPEMKFSDEKIEILKQDEKKNEIKEKPLTDEELKRLSYLGILDERKLTYLADESNVQKPAVIKSRRHNTFEEKCDTTSNESN